MEGSVRKEEEEKRKVTSRSTEELVLEKISTNPNSYQI